MIVGLLHDAEFKRAAEVHQVRLFGQTEVESGKFGEPSVICASSQIGEERKKVTASDN